MSSMNFELCNDISCNNYDATAVMYISINDIRDVFKFSTTDFSDNKLSSNALTSTSSDITYYLNSSSFPEINPVHAMMDVSDSEGIIYTSTNSKSNLLKHDYIYYLGQQLLGNATSIGLYNNIIDMKNKIEVFGWNSKIGIETKFSQADNSGNGMINTTTIPDYTNFTKRILEQIKHHQSSRLDIHDLIIDNQVLEKINHICDGSTIDVNNGNTITLQNVTSYQQLTTTATQINGSSITYTVPEYTTKILYKFAFQLTWNTTTTIFGDDSLIKLTVYINNSLYGDPEYVRLENLVEIFHTYEKIIDISDTVWSTNGKTIELKGEIINSNYTATLHYSNVSTSVIEPVLSLISLGTNNSTEEVDNTKSKVIEKIAYIGSITSGISVPTNLTTLYSTSYTPPTNTKFIHFSFIAKMTWNDTNVTINGHDSLLIWSIYIDNTEITRTKRRVRVGNLIEEDHEMKYTFSIENDTSWSSGKTIAIKGYSVFSEYPVKIFFTNHTQTVIKPKVEITALGNVTLPTNRVDPTEYPSKILREERYLSNVTASQTIPIGTSTEINGSSISFLPPKNTSKVVFKFKALATWNDSSITINGPDSLMKWSIFVDTQEITDSVKYIHVKNLTENFFSQEYIFDISSNYTNQEASGKFTTWNTAKVIKIKGESIYNGNYPVKLHYSNVESDIIKPEITIYSVGETSIVRNISKIKNTSLSQSVPLVKDDSINYYIDIDNTNNLISNRKYRIKLYLTDDTTKINTTPLDSIANTSEYPSITSNGVPQIS